DPGVGWIGHAGRRSRLARVKGPRGMHGKRSDKPLQLSYRQRHRVRSATTAERRTRAAGPAPSNSRRGDPEQRHQKMKSSFNTRTLRATTFQRAAIAVATVSLAAGAAHASEKVVRTPQGDVTVLTADADAQRKVPDLPASHPFATEKQRAAVAPLPWPAVEGARPKGAEAPLPAPRRPFLDTTTQGGSALPFAEYQARQQFGDAWRRIEALEGRDVEQPARQ